jgi:hypothetical protein
MDLSDILFWLFDDVIGWVILYLFPVAAIAYGVYCLLNGSYLWGAVAIGSGLFIGATLYSHISSRRSLD